MAARKATDDEIKAAPDSHASRGGWMSGRDAKVITYHAEHGEVGRIIVSADMLKGEAA